MPRDERGDADAARPNRGREEQGPAQPGQGQQGPIGLTQKHAAQGEPAEGPRHADGLGQSEGGHVGGGAAAPGGVSPAAAAMKRASTSDEHERAVPIERPGPHEPQGEAADTGPPPRPQSRRPGQSGQTPVEQPGAGQTQGPPPPRREGKGQQDSGDQRRQQDPATARRRAHVEAASMAAARRPFRWRCRRGCPRRDRPTRPRPRRRVGPPPPRYRWSRSRWCTRYCGKASGQRVTRASIGAPDNPTNAPSSSQTRSITSASVQASARSSPKRPSEARRRCSPGRARCGHFCER